MFPYFKQISLFFQNFLNFLTGERCFICNKSNKFICEDCFPKLPFIKGYICNICSSPIQGRELCENLICGECLKNPPSFKKVIAPFWYEDIMRELMHEIKFQGKYYYVYKIFELIKEGIFDFYKSIPMQDIYIIPIPLSKGRKISRGYNQSFLIAKELSKVIKAPVLNNFLIKIKELQPMMTLNREERFKNIKGAFSVAKKNSVDRIILVDDIITSTATIREASYVLKKGGCNEIYVFALCRAKN
ncbi:MAG: ComF family protein [Proteobacteria bacterium]|nr:ComF family protein [Pseudomonadota bacterium]